MSILIIDNYDSFTYNLVQYVGEIGADPLVLRNDAFAVADIADIKPDAIIVSPGPCTPSEAGVSVQVIREWGSSVPILGVCLGHQSIAEAYGAKVVRAGRVMHGKVSAILHDGSGLFAGISSPLSVMRYHSLVVEYESLNDSLLVTAVADDDNTEIHALRHASFPVYGVQFHPESVMTQDGKQILRNFIQIARDWSSSAF